MLGNVGFASLPTERTGRFGHAQRGNDAPPQRTRCLTLNGIHDQCRGKGSENIQSGPSAYQLS